MFFYRPFFEILYVLAVRANCLEFSNLNSGFSILPHFELPVGSARYSRTLRFCRWHSVAPARQGPD